MNRKAQRASPTHRFECDKAKAISNYKKHGFKFTEGCRVFAEHTLTGLSKSSPEIGEDRFVTIGMLSERIATVIVWTKRGSNIRVISVRKASHQEREHLNAYLKKALN